MIDLKRQESPTGPIILSPTGYLLKAKYLVGSRSVRSSSRPQELKNFKDTTHAAD